MEPKNSYSACCSTITILRTYPAADVRTFLVPAAAAISLVASGSGANFSSVSLSASLITLGPSAKRTAKVNK